MTEIYLYRRRDDLYKYSQTARLLLTERKNTFGYGDLEESFFTFFLDSVSQMLASNFEAHYSHLLEGSYSSTSNGLNFIAKTGIV